MYPRLEPAGGTAVGDDIGKDYLDEGSGPVIPTESLRMGEILFGGEDEPEPEPGPNDGDRGGPDGRGCRRSAILALALIVAFLILILAWCSGDDGIEVSIDGNFTTVSSTASGASSSSSSPASSSSSSEAQQPQPATTGDEVLDAILEFFGVSPEDEESVSQVEDDLRDLIDSIRGLVPAYQGRDVDIKQAIMFLLGEYSGSPISSIRQVRSVFDCGGTGPLVICSDQVLEMPAGDILIVAMEVDEAIPLASADRSYIYSIVFDSDNAPENNWVFNPPFDFDYFQGTDRWYQAVYDHVTATWTITVTQLNLDGTVPNVDTPTAARLAIDGPWAVWFIPTSELATYPAPLRVTAFAHDGFFSEGSRGGDVLGPDPTVPLGLPMVGTAVMTEG